MLGFASEIVAALAAPKQSCKPTTIAAIRIGLALRNKNLEPFPMHSATGVGIVNDLTTGSESPPAQAQMPGTDSGKSGPESCQVRCRMTREKIAAAGYVGRAAFAVSKAEYSI